MVLLLGNIVYHYLLACLYSPCDSQSEILYSSELEVYAYAAAQVKKAMEVHSYRYSTIIVTRSIVLSKPLFISADDKNILQVTHYLGGENYVFWGGREGYQSLLNTDMERELNHLVCESIYP